MTSSSIAALPRLVDATPDATAVHLELESLRLLLLRVAEALCSGDASQVQQLSTDLDRCAVNLRPAFGKLLLDGKDLSLVECEQQRRRILQPLLEARSYYRAALRRGGGVWFCGVA